MIEFIYIKTNCKHFNIVANYRIETNSPILDGNHGWLCTCYNVKNVESLLPTQFVGGFPSIFERIPQSLRHSPS